MLARFSGPTASGLVEPGPAHSAPVSILRSADAAAEHGEACQALLRRAVEPNVFLAPEVLVPAMRHLPAGDKVQIVLVHHPREAGRLIGVFPLVMSRRLNGLPLRHLSLWRHPHLFVGSPPIDRDHVALAWRSVLEWARAQGALVLNLPLLSADVADTVPGPAVELDRFRRPIFVPHPGGAARYVEEASSTKSRKSWRRQARRLSELGHLELRRLEPGEDAFPWIEAFLRLEAGGWKGAAGSALASDPAEAAFFREMARAAHADGMLHFLGYYLDGRPVALQCNLFAGGVGYAFKVAFDEAHSALSPGALLELAAVEDFHDRAGLVLVDSCASRATPLMGRIWTDTREMRHLIVPVPGVAPRMVCSALGLGLRVRRAFRKGRP